MIENECRPSLPLNPSFVFMWIVSVEKWIEYHQSHDIEYGITLCRVETSAFAVESLFNCDMSPIRVDSFSFESVSR